MFFFNRKLVTATGLLLLSSFSHAAFLTEPDPKWSIQLRDSGKQSGRGLRQGNAIVSHRDGAKIVVTANDASLHIIQTTNQVKTLGVFEPEAIGGKTTECVSAPTIVYAVDQEGLFSSVEGEEEETLIPRTEDFVLYAVIDKSGGVGHSTSRLVAVDMEGALKWSFDFEGTIEGSPAVGKSGIYVTTNYKSDMGIVSKLQISPKDGSLVLVATAGVYDVQLGPPVLRQDVEIQDNKNNNKNNEPNNDEDIVVVAESGSSQTQGGLYMFPTELTASPQVEIEDELSIDVETTGRFDYELSKISSWSYSATAPPLVYGNSIFLGAAGGTIGGFTGDRKNDLSGITSGRETAISPLWDFQMSPNPLDASRPVQTQPSVSQDGSILCSAGVDNDFYCVSVEEGRQLWRNEEASEFLAQPIIYRGERRIAVYAIETGNGRVHQYDLFSGRRFWNYSCSDASNNLCQDPVEAGFAITPGGNTLFYGDIYGRINCLGVASFDTESPTIAPTGTPTISPSASPTITATPTEMPQEAVVASTEGPWMNDYERDDVIVLGGEDEASASEASWFSNNRKTVYIAGVVAALCAIIIPFLLCAMVRRKKKKLLTNKNLVVEMVDDCSSDEDDIEAQAQQFFDQIETTNTYGASGDGIEIEVINTPKGRTSKKTRKHTPNTVNNSFESTDDSSAMAVLGTQYNVEGVNLGQTFDQLSEHNTDDSRSLDDVPPPPPPPVLADEASVTKSTTSERSFAMKGKLTMGWLKTNKKNTPPAAPKPVPDSVPRPEKEQALVPPAVNEVEESPDPVEEELDEETSTEEIAYEENYEEEDTDEEDEAVTVDEKSEAEAQVNETQSEKELPETPASPSVYDVVSDAMKYITPSDAEASSAVIERSMSGASDDSSLYTSYTGTSGLFGGKSPKKETNDMSLYNKYVYDEEVRRRDRDEIVNEKKSYLSQPGLDDEHPDDEAMNHRRGTSARADKFLSKNSTEKESAPATIAQMYDQLAAIGQQRREDRGPSFNRRNTKHDQAAAKQKQVDTWGSFLNELAEAEKDFYSPSSKSKALLDKSKTDNAAELPKL